MGHYADFRVVDLIVKLSYYSFGGVSISYEGSMWLFFSGFGSSGHWGFGGVELDSVGGLEAS